MAFRIQCHARGQRHFLERPITLIVIQEFAHRIVGHEKVDVAIAIVVSNTDAQPLTRRCQSQLLRNLCKVTAAVIVIDKGRNGAKRVWMAVSAKPGLVFATPDIVEIPIQVAQYNEIEQAVVIEVDPGRTC